MPVLEWNDALELGVDAMDDTHREFVVLLAQTQAADDAQLLAVWDALIAHTEAHFGQEDRWMQHTGFTAGNCHSSQHQVVLQIMREGAERGASGALQVVRDMAAELGPWFTHHAQNMDAALARHFQAVDFDPVTGIVRQPQSLPAAPIHGCGGACSSGDDHRPPPAHAAAAAEAAHSA